MKIGENKFLITDLEDAKDWIWGGERTIDDIPTKYHSIFLYHDL